MAPFNVKSAARLVVMLGFSSLLAGCALSGSNAVSVQDPTTETRVENRFSEDATYTTVVPRDPISSGDIDPDAPDSYTVVRGDTLWDISDRFLDKAWLWPQLWDYNPQIPNPHLIYPGDKISLEYINGSPTLVIDRNGQRVSQSGAAGNANGLTTERLSPRIRSESLDDAIPMISGDAIHSFLVHPRVVSATALDSAPYVVGNYDGRLTSAVGHQIYVRGNLSREQPQYAVFRKSKKLSDPVTKKTLGYEVRHVADVKLMHLSDPSTLIITSNNMETIAGDLLLPTNDDGIVHSYTTRMPKINGEGRIVSLVNAIAQSGRNQVIVLNLGKDSNVNVGDVLAIESRGGTFIDTRGKMRREEVKMPNTRTGVVMVFKTFDKVSYALVMESTLPVRVNDVVTGI